MRIDEWNDLIGTAVVEDLVGEDVWKDYCFLKRVNEGRGIIDEDNREKFIALIRSSDQWGVDMNFSYENFRGADLSDMKFYNCSFTETDFEKTNLDAIEFHSCNLDKANFFGAVMECAWFKKCSCVMTDFSKTHLLAASIHQSDWSKANTSGANLMEIDAFEWIVDDMIVDEKTAIVDGEFHEVNWSKVNVSRLNISLNQVKYFLQSTNGGKYLQVYEDYTPSDYQKKEDAIFNALCDEYGKNKKEEGLDTTGDDVIFLSYASEQETVVRGFYEKDRNRYHLWMDVELVREKELKLQIDQVIDSCKMAVVFLTKEYLIKAWTRYELWRLLEEKKKRGVHIVIVQMAAGAEDALERYRKEEGVVVVKDVGELEGYLNGYI